jgi:hypothetical protein
MRRQALQKMFLSLALVILSSLWWAGCTRQGAPPTAAPQAAALDRSAEQAAIRQNLHQYLEANGQGGGPEKNVELSQVAIDSGYALVTWAHEGRGGQAVLRNEAGTWKVLEYSPGWLGLKGVSKENVPVEVAKRLLDGIDPNWPSYETY